jgi:hypothetical protein
MADRIKKGRLQHKKQIPYSFGRVFFAPVIFDAIT